MNLKNVDLNLLVVFDAIFRQRSVGLAGQMLGISQPAVSHALARLRQLFDDPMFVRINNEMRPTDRASELMPSVERVLSMIRDDVLQPVGFDPAANRRTLTLCMPDIGEQYFLPPLINHLAQVAPGMAVVSHELAPAQLEEALESGRVDLAIGYFPDLRRAVFYQQRLFYSGFCCAVRQGHPQIGKTLSLPQFLQAEHVTARLRIRSQEIAEQAMREQGIVRNVKLQTSHFLSLTQIIAQTDLLATVTYEAAQLLQAAGKVHIYPVPFPIPQFPVMQYWHERAHHDRGNQWLRGEIRGLFQRDNDNSADECTAEH
ncbi:HTH-type transcriptional regulator LeuO [compost metagenome]|jgi:DNA-binding transcriptional LysR family regulator|uniref:Transcriptional regulator, LysR family n=1 Tax=Serratia proteamaculans (strain 568) TaxID=399741 RepID=A8GKS5_SERP5